MRRTIATAVVALATALAVLPAGSSSAEGSKTRPDTSGASALAARQAGQALSRAEQILGGSRGDKASPDATLALRDLFVALPDLDANDRRQAEGVLARPGNGGGTPGKKCKGHFCLHYVTGTTDAPPSMAWVNLTLKTMNAVWKREVGKLGYRKPLSDGGKGGSRKFDVYLRDVGAQNLYGYCAPETRHEKYTASGYCVLDNDFNPAQFGGAPATNSLRVTAAHEFFHAIQFGYDFAEDRWFMESTATWMEERFADKVNDNRQYLPYGTLANPASSLDLYNSSGFNQYANWTFFEYLSSRHGVKVVRSIWRKAAAYKGAPDKYSIKAVASVLKKKGGLTRTFGKYAAANVHPGHHYAEGKHWPSATVAHKMKLAKAHRKGSAKFKINHLASRNVVVKPAKSLSSKKWRLRVKVSGPSRKSAPTAYIVVARKHAKNITKAVKLNRKGNGRVAVPFRRKLIKSVTVTLANSSSRFRNCYSQTNPKPYSCSGTPRDQHNKFKLRVAAFKR